MFLFFAIPVFLHKIKMFFTCGAYSLRPKRGPLKVWHIGLWWCEVLPTATSLRPNNKAEETKAGKSCILHSVGWVSNEDDG